MFKNLIKNDLLKKETEQRVFLSNALLTEILQKEYFMDTILMHKFEVEIYLNVLKRYIKCWPDWDTFADDVVDLQDKGDEEGIATLLKEKRLSMKEYLGEMLDIAQELAGEKVEELLAKERRSDEGVIMEVEATAQQLRSLFYRHPLRGSIFNASDGPPPALRSPKRLTFESIVNWTGVEIAINLKAEDKLLIYKRRNIHKLEHKLVNMKLERRERQGPDLNGRVMLKLGKRRVTMTRDALEKLLRQALSSEANENWYSVRNVLEKALIDELAHLPERLDIDCDLKRHISGRYERYFSQEPEGGEGADKYDLRLEEVVSPIAQYSFSLCGLPITDDGQECIALSCHPCQATFDGGSAVCDILKHFSALHVAEPDWTCPKCLRVFTMSALTHAAWDHTCGGGA
ncbi:unnamed protein product, partial [Iphiclides podalirius]